MAAMTRKERVRAALAGREVDRAPASLWGHDFLREWAPRDLVAQTLESYRAYGWDFIKLNPRATYFAEAWGNTYDRPDIQRQPRMLSCVVGGAGDLDRVRAVDGRAGVFGDHLFALRLVVDEVGEEVDVVQTVFSPLSVAALLCGARTEFRGFAAENPGGAHAAVQQVTETLAAYARASISTGAAGIFFAPLGWSSRDVCDDDFYREFGRPYDLQVLSQVREAEFNILHVCRDRNRIEMLLDYPVAAVNWADRGPGNPSLAEVKARTRLAVMGGVDHVRLHVASAAEVGSQVLDAVRQAGPDRLLVAGGCGISPETPPGNLRAVAEAAGIA